MAGASNSMNAPLEFDFETVEKFLNSESGKGCLRGEWKHDKSVSSAYWDPRGRGIVSTSYDDNIRCKPAVSLLSLVSRLTVD